MLPILSNKKSKRALEGAVGLLDGDVAGKVALFGFLADHTQPGAVNPLAKEPTNSSYANIPLESN